MISFIVIGKNEGERLIRCFKSIVKIITIHNYSDYEIIYVDSKSNDNSITEAHKIPNTRVFLITGVCNAAIARNIGGKEAKGDILYFIDGDLELNEDFLSHVLNKDHTLIYPFISGIVTDYNYDHNWNFINIHKRHTNTEDIFQPAVGGVFIITKEKWNEIGGMCSEMTINEDLDLGMRMYEKGYPLLLKSLLMVNHHTIPYRNDKRIKDFTYREAKYNAVLLRRHYKTLKTLLFVLRMRFTFFLLLFSMLLMILHPIAIFIYPLYVTSLSIKTYKREKVNPLKYCYYAITGDLLFIIHLFTFFPKKLKISYRKT